MKSKNEGKHGGRRKGSGRKLKYGEETVNVLYRVPKSKESKFREMAEAFLKKYEITPPSKTTTRAVQ